VDNLAKTRYIGGEEEGKGGTLTKSLTKETVKIT